MCIPSKIDTGKIPTDHNGVKDRQNDITYSDRNSCYDENITRLIDDYASFVTEMKDLLEEAICKVNDEYLEPIPKILPSLSGFSPEFKY
jgi:hypothetical protein